MFDKSLDIIYNKPYLVIVPTTAKDLLDGFAYTLGNTILMGDTAQEYEQTLTFISNNNFKRIIFVDYKSEYATFINKFKADCEFDFIYTGSLGSLSIEFQYDSLKSILSIYEKLPNSKLALLDEGMYNALNKKYQNVFLLSLDVAFFQPQAEYDDSQIGIINESKNPRHSYYNELSALTFFPEITSKLLVVDKQKRRFL